MIRKTSKFQEFSNVIIGLVLWIFLFIPFFILPVLLPLAVLRHFVHFLARLHRPDLIPLNSKDSSITLPPSLWGQGNKILENNVTQIWRIQGKLDADRFRDHFYSTFLATEESRQKYKNFFCYFVLWNLYCFKKAVPDINLTEHIKERYLTSEEYLNLEEFIASWMSKGDYGFDKPKWQILICYFKKTVDACDKTDDMFQTILLFKIDHALCDGYTFVHLTEKITGVKSPYLVREVNQTAFDKVKLQLSFPKLVIVDTALKPMITLIKGGQLDLDTAKEPKQLISFTTLDLDVIKKIRHKQDVHFSSILAVIQASALRRYLIETGRVPREDDLPEYTYCDIPVGVPGHLAMTRGGMTNHYGLSCWRVPFLDKKPIERRLLETDEFHLGIKESGMGQMMHNFTLPCLWPLPTLIYVFVLQKFVIFKFYPMSQIISPQVLSNEPYQLLGHRVDHIYVAANTCHLLPVYRITVIPTTNGGRLDLTVLSVTGIFKSQSDLDRYTKVAIKEELDYLGASCNSNESFRNVVNIA